MWGNELSSGFLNDGWVRWQRRATVAGSDLHLSVCLPHTRLQKHKHWLCKSCALVWFWQHAVVWEGFMTRTLITVHISELKWHVHDGDREEEPLRWCPFWRTEIRLTPKSGLEYKQIFKNKTNQQVTSQRENGRTDMKVWGAVSGFCRGLRCPENPGPRLVNWWVGHTVAVDKQIENRAQCL